MAQDTLLGFPAHTLPYRRGKFITLSTASRKQPVRMGRLLQRFVGAFALAGSGLFQQTQQAGILLPSQQGSRR